MSDAARPVERSFGEILLAWYGNGHRDLPWRRASDPYRIWVSEIMLQQTRAQAVIPYYERFLARFPTVEDLAAASEPDVLAQWSGLGYYSRARNLRRAAQRIVAAGGLPREYDAIRALPGVGDYTAAAIASMAFGLPHVVVDGNVLRVVARVENDASDIGAGRTRQRFRDIAQGWLGSNPPGLFNQALMELGATVCLPRSPLCLICPVAASCRACARGAQSQLPVKLRRMSPERIDGELLIVRDTAPGGGRILLRQRSAGARRMAGFWDLPAPEELPEAQRGRRLGQIRHTITRHRYTFTVREAILPQAQSAAAPRTPEPAAGDRAPEPVAWPRVPEPAPEPPEFGWFDPERLAEIPLSTTARKALNMAREKSVAREIGLLRR